MVWKRFFIYYICSIVGQYIQAFELLADAINWRLEAFFLFKMIFLHIVYGYVSIFKYIKVNLFICNLIRKGKLHLISSRILYTLLIMKNLFSFLYYTRFPFLFVNCLSNFHVNNFISKYNQKNPPTFSFLTPFDFSDIMHGQTFIISDVVCLWLSD